MSDKSMVSPEDQGATFVELFFDLVFVFAITQVTRYAALHLDVMGLVRAALVFWLIWWGWTQFTWALNAANTDHHHVRVGTLIATGIAFVMAVSVERAFAAEPSEALWFALSYVVGRAVGLGLYYRVVSSNTEYRSAVATFAALSIAGLIAVAVGGFLDPSLRIWVWFGAVALDLGAAWAASARVWDLHASHFAERHGLIVMIALGESLIVAASALTSDVTPARMVTGSAAVLLTCLLWWTYFGWVREVLEEKMVSVSNQERTLLGRDTYTFWHFPLVSGIIATAVGFEASFHPNDYSSVQIAASLGVGLTLFLASTAGALWRATRCVLLNRLIVLTLALITLALNATGPPNLLLGIGCAGLALIVGIEQVTVRRRLARQ